MKQFLHPLGIVFAVCCIVLTSCSKNEEEPTEPELLVTNINLAGNWQLVEWDGKPLDADAYFFITFERRELKFTIHSRLETMYDHTLTGKYVLTTDKDTGVTTLSGFYDYDAGAWANEYVVSKLTETQLLLTSSKEPASTRRYVKVETLPTFETR